MNRPFIFYFRKILDLYLHRFKNHIFLGMPDRNFFRMCFYQSFPILTLLWARTTNSIYKVVTFERNTFSFFFSIGWICQSIWYQASYCIKTGHFCNSLKYPSMWAQVCVIFWGKMLEQPCLLMLDVHHLLLAFMKNSMPTFLRIPLIVGIF